MAFRQEQEGPLRGPGVFDAAIAGRSVLPSCSSRAIPEPELRPEEVGVCLSSSSADSGKPATPAPTTHTSLSICEMTCRAASTRWSKSGRLKALGSTKWAVDCLAGAYDEQ